MKIFVNDKEITIHHGATVLDVMRSYYAVRNKKLPCKLPIVTDSYDNSVASDGELTEGNHLYIKNKNNRTNENIFDKTKSNLWLCSDWYFFIDKLRNKP